VAFGICVFEEMLCISKRLVCTPRREEHRLFYVYIYSNPTIGATALPTEYKVLPASHNPFAIATPEITELAVCIPFWRAL
jgi:hypothetical protein